MQYFIPAWYKDNDWKENEQVWYRARTVTEFDDTVKQIQLFFRNKVAPFRILNLGFSPNFRHFLHRQGVYHAPYISCFDAMQGISAESIRLFSFHDLTWPDGVEFIYSPFAVIVRKNGGKYAQIEFAEDGNMFRVDMFHNEQRICSNCYDDRGFISCQIVYRNGEPFREQYFNENGIWKFARFLDDGHVVINPESSWFLVPGSGGKQRAEYSRRRYDRIDEVIEEVLRSFLEVTSEKDSFIIAMHPLHSEVLSEVLDGRRTLLSFFERRFVEENIAGPGRKLIESADCIVADRKTTADILRRHIDTDSVPLKVITPYDSRVEFSRSQHLRVQNILLAVDRLSGEYFSRLTVTLAEYVLRRNDRARICLFTRSARYNERGKLLGKTEEALQRAGIDPDFARDEKGVSESPVDASGQVRPIFSVAQCVDEMSVNRTLREQRVIVDLQDIPDQFLQISAVSMGIPQITLSESDYVADGKNGTVVSEPDQLPDALDYYLKNIAHYNAAQIASYDLGSEFSTGRLVDSWKEVISSLERKSSSAGER